MGANSNRLLGALLLALPSCSDAGSRGDAGVAQSGIRDGGRREGSAVDGIKLCDGSDSLRLAFEGNRSDCSDDLPCPGGRLELRVRDVLPLEQTPGQETLF
jgi:hypothetical protein